VEVQYFLEFHLCKQHTKSIFISNFIMPLVIQIGNDILMIKIKITTKSSKHSRSDRLK